MTKKCIFIGGITAKYRRIILNKKIDVDKRKIIGYTSNNLMMWEAIMVKRVISFLFDEKDTEVINETAKRLRSMEGNVPEIRSIEVGVDEMHTEKSFSVVLIVTFDNKEDLQKYIVDKYHVEHVAMYIRKHCKMYSLVEYTY